MSLENRMPSLLPDLPDAHRDALASVTLRSAELDHLLELAINSALVDSQRTAKFLLANVSGERIVNLLRALLVDRFPEEEAAIEAMIARVGECRRERNELIHWIWKANDDPVEIRLLQMRPHREHRSKSRTADEIMSIADAMGN
jgi:hypothetical protein